MSVNRAWRRYIAALSFAATVAFLAVGCGSEGGQRPGDAPESAASDIAALPSAPAADHHLHIRSAAGVAITDEIRALRSPGAAPEVPESPVDANDVIAALDSAGIERGLVLSIAYMFGAPELEVPNEYAKVRAENDYVAEQVADYPSRLVGACSVNPLADYAIREIERCGHDPRLGALKLHLANSDVDLRNPSHLARLGEIFAVLAELDLPAVVHLRTRTPDYGAEDVRLFIDEVLSQAPRLPVQIAHMVGWGGYDEATDAALVEFDAALKDGRLDPDLYTFDLGAVVFQPDAAGADTALARSVREANETLARRIRSLGLDRVVFATDWPSWPPVGEPVGRIASNVRLVRAELPLTEEDRAQVFGNVSPLFRRRPRVEARP